MKILNFGSLNIDYVYRVDEFVRPAETKSVKGLLVNCGGKGLNQSIAAARAGNEVYHAGLYGNDGDMLLEKLIKNGVNVDYLNKSKTVSGHAIIEVNDAGQNRILLYGGANMELTKELIDVTLSEFAPGETLVLMQNETNMVDYIIERAHECGHITAFNAAPMNERVASYPLDKLDYLIVNEVEGAGIAGETAPCAILDTLEKRYPNLTVLLTLGELGSACRSKGVTATAGCFNTRAVDTTAAGDTFTGYFLYGMLNGEGVERALAEASAASAIAVTREGAADSVPERAVVVNALKNGALGEIGEYRG